MQPKVSVITTVYNGEIYFDRSVPSILSQTYGNFEWLIVDDGSTDQTPTLLAQIAQQDSRVKVLSPGRLGFVKALNYAISKASGEYIARQDFDDFSSPERLQKQVDFLDSHPSVGLVGCHYIVEDENRQERYIRMVPESHDAIVNTMAKCIPFAHTLVMFRKNAWVQAGGYPELDDIEDLRLWITFAKSGWNLANLPIPLGHHWVHAKSFWHSNFDYSRRQRKLADVQWQAIRELKLPWWTGIYPLGRLFYCYLPKDFKSFLRRVAAGSQEKDLSVTL
jgi:glycosyltransferase EpsE